MTAFRYIPLAMALVPRLADAGGISPVSAFRLQAQSDFVDSDADAIRDAEDKCPTQAGAFPTGCPGDDAATVAAIRSLVGARGEVDARDLGPKPQPLVITGAVDIRPEAWEDGSPIVPQVSGDWMQSGTIGPAIGEISVSLDLQAPPVGGTAEEIAASLRSRGGLGQASLTFSIGGTTPDQAAGVVLGGGGEASYSPTSIAEDETKPPQSEPIGYAGAKAHLYGWFGPVILGTDVSTYAAAADSAVGTEMKGSFAGRAFVYIAIAYEEGAAEPSWFAAGTLTYTGLGDGNWADDVQFSVMRKFEL